MRLRFYEIYKEYGHVMATEVEQGTTMKAKIGIKGKIPDPQDEVKMRKGKAVVHAQVTTYTSNGIPLQGIVTYADAASDINEGEVIEFVGYIIQLLNLLDVIFRKVKGWFSKKAPSARSVAATFVLLFLSSCTLFNPQEAARKASMGKRLYRQAISFERNCEVFLKELTYCRNWKIQI